MRNDKPTTLPEDPAIEEIEDCDSKTFIRMCGEYVCVRWNAREEVEREETKTGGWTRTLRRIVPYGDPYIDFVYIRENNRER